MKPESKCDTKEAFGVLAPFDVPCYHERTEYVPQLDETYTFHRETVLALLSGFAQNKNTFVTGAHGTGKSTHIEQVAARLNWPCLRVNLDTHLSRFDLIGKDVIVLDKGKQVTTFKEGLLPWALQRNIALILDEYDAAHPEILFILQRFLEEPRKLVLFDQHRTIIPHPYFRLFATSNTIGQGNTSGLYHGVHVINQGNLDRWSIVATLDYLGPEEEFNLLYRTTCQYGLTDRKSLLRKMIQMANLTRQACKDEELSSLISLRTLKNWVEQYATFKDLTFAFKVTYFNKCDPDEKPFVRECFQRVFGIDIP